MTKKQKWFENEKDKRFIFFANRFKRETESRPTIGTLPFARRKSQRFAKVIEPKLPTLKKMGEINNIFVIITKTI